MQCPCGSADQGHAEGRWGVPFRTFSHLPGSGNTAALVRTIVAFKDELRIGVRAVEIDSDVDARTSQCAGVAQAIRLHTDGMCCLNADMPATVLRA
jgi:Ni2+-binding GTPase involved in maturation of urease and hydrogenase